MKVKVNIRKDEPRLTRLRYEPSCSKYILAYSDEENPRVADPEEIGDLADSAIVLDASPDGALAAPLVAQIAVTNDCNLACKFCYAELNEYRHDRMMRTGEIKRIIDMLYETGVIYLEWSGGEPLMREDFIELMLYARKLDFKQSIITNGTHFGREFLKYGSKCLRKAQISIDDVREDYNALKGGPFWKVLQENIVRGLEAGLPAVASIVITETNAPRLEEIIHFIWETGFKNARLCWQVPLGEAKSQSLMDYRALVSATVSKIRHLQREYADRGLHIFSVQERGRIVDEFLPKEFLLCSAGRTRLHIDWNGDAFGCPLLKYDELRAGNVLDNGIQNVWASPAFDGMRQVKNGDVCARCKLYCSYWCRAIAYGFTRNMSLTPSPICHHTWKHGSGGTISRPNRI